LIKKKILILISTLAVLGLLVSFFQTSGDKPLQNSGAPQKSLDIFEAEETDHSEEESTAHRHNHSLVKQQKLNKIKKTLNIKKFPSDFNFQDAKASLEKLKKNYPKSKRDLLNMILAPNEFASAEPHSAAELAQRQKGALRVEALKILTTLEKDPERSKEDLKMVLKNSQDPVMKKIAKAALDSQAKGRPFFSDAVRALENLPLPD